MTRWTDALKVWNSLNIHHNDREWAVPRKGTPDHEKVVKIMQDAKRGSEKHAATRTVAVKPLDDDVKAMINEIVEKHTGKGGEKKEEKKAEKKEEKKDTREEDLLKALKKIRDESKKKHRLSSIYEELSYEVQSDDPEADKKFLDEKLKPLDDKAKVERNEYDMFSPGISYVTDMDLTALIRKLENKAPAPRKQLATKAAKRRPEPHKREGEPEAIKLHLHNEIATLEKHLKDDVERLARAGLTPTQRNTIETEGKAMKKSLNKLKKELKELE